MSVEMIRAFFRGEVETTEHALLLCEWTRLVWFEIMGSRIGREPPSSLERRTEGLMCDNGLRGEVKAEVLTTVAFTLWQIWKERNHVVFNHEVPQFSGTIHRVRRATTGEFCALTGIDDKRDKPIEEGMKGRSQCRRNGRRLGMALSR